MSGLPVIAAEPDCMLMGFNRTTRQSLFRSGRHSIPTARGCFCSTPDITCAGLGRGWAIYNADRPPFDHGPGQPTQYKYAQSREAKRRRVRPERDCPALICLGQPRTLSSVPCLGEWRADASHERLGARKRLSPETQSLCRPPPTRNTVLERLPVLCVCLERACSLAGDICRQQSRWSLAG
jgi:hypothetical protein